MGLCPPLCTHRWSISGPLTMPLDTLDRRLLALLQANARASAADLARQLNVARTTVLARLARLEREAVITGYTVKLGAGRDGHDGHSRHVQAYVGITVAPKAAGLVTQRLAALPELQQLCSVSGEFDYLALIGAESTARLDSLLDEIGAMEGVVRTNTSVVLDRRIDRS
jgi:DNA-binding Lrp family transcriptional regulator